MASLNTDTSTSTTSNIYPWLHGPCKQTRAAVALYMPQECKLLQRQEQDFLVANDAPSLQHLGCDGRGLAVLVCLTDDELKVQEKVCYDGLLESRWAEDAGSSYAPRTAAVAGSVTGRRHDPRGQGHDGGDEEHNGGKVPQGQDSGEARI
uniref:Uncharacterized protein n=1 Tax=Oryza barthii TaxID=65489 RepID=A0A0D3HCY6_9ORYZ